MSKFNTSATRAAVTSPVRTEAAPTALTHEGYAGYARDAKSELFLLAVSNMVGEDTFYEGADDRDDRYRELIRQVAVTDGPWLARFLPWLRAEANMRSAPLVGALEAVKARLAANVEDDVANRALVASVLQRADEPGEALAYWTSRYGRAVPKPVKRGVADAVSRLYNERSLLKYDSDAKGYRFGDVIDLVHPAPAADKPWQGDLFQHALDRRHNRDNPIPERLQILTCRALLMAVKPDIRRSLLDPVTLKSAGMTWESLAGWLQGPMDAKAWEAVIPSMGYMALLRNLRNFDDAGVSDEVAERVAARLADPDEVARSRQFPFRFYAAYRAAQSLRWGHSLEKALRASLANVPALPGRTLVVVDQSPSMFPGCYFSTPSKSDISNADKAKLFGAAVALRANDATLVGYGTRNYRVDFRQGDAVLRLMEKFRMEDGTDTLAAIGAHFDGHDRVLVITDEQTQYSRYTSVDQVVPRNVPVYTWNLAGYRVGTAPSGTGQRHTFGGLTDAAFRMVPLLEAGRNADWPF